ncbi:hypothetical protein LTR56_004613 [Elasticomyces elasticus]|nr:hypothetical protein LTR56_004613 [Elasticomyces elasticus]KAK3659867.1 hypothetical protein LTR22_008234 [Elasticomyces elasticus]KAK4925953.1 hypothetical protein LTR49_007091 [Elasticomyces elasticus]KAK5768189.1 hypothetical protein LTS12_001673 [Elasticomyces elasticus]
MSPQNFGLLREGAGNAVIRPIPLPKLRDNYVLIRTVAIALNPTDWTTLDAKGDDGTIVGCDFAGIVEEVGSAVTKSFKKGDKVTGLAHGGWSPRRQQRHIALANRDAAVGKQIRQDTDGKITKVFDTVGMDTSAAICADAIGASGGMHCTLLPVETSREEVESIFFLGYDITGESYKFEGESYPAKPELFEWTKKFTTLAEKLWAEGKWQPHPQSVKEGGLLGAVEGMNLMREGKGPSGEKWVYRVDDTKWP